MKKRRAVATGETGSGIQFVTGIEVVTVDAAPMVTLDNPFQGVEKAQGAFVRIRPPVDMAADETRVWANLAREKALAVRVLPTRRSEVLVPVASSRLDEPAGSTIREEIEALVKDDPELREFVDLVLAEVDRK